MLLTILQCSLFVLSLYGYHLFFRKTIQLHPKISPVAACCLTILILYAGAFAGLLYPTAIFILVAGGGLVVYYYYRDYQRGQLVRPPINLNLIWLGLYFIIFASTLLHSHLEHYDNYTYWARIVKYFYTEGQLPTASAKVIEYPSYPIAGSLFVYLATVVAGFGDNVMLIGQFIFIFACIYATFAVVRDESQMLIMVVMFTTISVFNYYNIAIRMNNLLVDFLIPVLTLAGMAGAYRMQKNLKSLCLYVFLIAAVLTMLKSNAIFFTLILLLYFLSRIYRYHSQTLKNRWVKWGYGLATILISLLPYMLWRLHVAATFTETKHDASVSSMSKEFASKTGGVIDQITDQFVQAVFNVNTLSTQGIILINLVLIIVYIGIRRMAKKESRLLQYLLMIDGMLIVYYLGIYAMFLFSMPTNEALQLAGFDRYASSIVILGLGISMMILAREIDYALYEQEIESRTYRSFKNQFTKSFYQYSTAALLFCATMLMLSENNGMTYNNENFEHSVPAKYIDVVGNNMTLNNDKYLVVSTDETNVDSYLIQHAGKYFLYSINVDAIANFDDLDDQEFEDFLDNYDQIVILDHHMTFNQRTEKLFEKKLKRGQYPMAQLLGSENN